MTPNESESDRDAASGEDRERNPDSPLTDQTPFQRFEDFARKVISVPRREIEEREQAYQENRKGKPSKVIGPP